MGAFASRLRFPVGVVSFFEVFDVTDGDGDGGASWGLESLVVADESDFEKEDFWLSMKEDMVNSVEGVCGSAQTTLGRGKTKAGDGRTGVERSKS
jgi:hypothetical protein